MSLWFEPWLHKSFILSFKKNTLLETEPCCSFRILYDCNNINSMEYKPLQRIKELPLQLLVYFEKNTYETSRCTHLIRKYSLAQALKVLEHTSWPSQLFFLQSIHFPWNEDWVVCLAFQLCYFWIFLRELLHWYFR